MVLTTLWIAAAVLLAVVVLAAFVFRGPTVLRRGIESLFRRPEPTPRTAGEEQYYRPYWSR